MIRVILFDFDGVILDSEDLHYEAFRKVFEEEGFSLSRETYYQHCLGFNDVECIRWGLAATGKIEEGGGLDPLVQRKSVYFDELLKNQMRFFPGVLDFIRAAGGKYPLAITSMARREEIEFVLRQAGLSDLFCLIVSGEDVENTKPHPEAYEKTLRLLNDHLSLSGQVQSIQPGQCLVIEDSAAGIQSAKAAGMRVLGLAHTEEPSGLRKADRVLPSLEGTSLEDVEAIFNP
jgi:HAD superfamily hydrolase (TIGR01509 family)